MPVIAVDALRTLIYRAKGQIQRNPALYQAVYSLATFNLDYFRQWLERDKYLSSFGGQWTDRKDFEELLKRKKSSGQVDSEAEARLRQWRQDGYIVLENAVEPALIDLLNRELEELPRKHPPGLKVTGRRLSEPTPYSPELIQKHESIRIVDHYFFSVAARRILFSASLTGFLERVFEARPMLTQSLGFEYGSEQDIHQDTAFVITNSPLKMVGIWIALKDVQPGSGELVYYPGSHAWPDYLFSGRFKHFDRERDGMGQVNDWFAWLHEEAARRNVPLKSFLPKKGDALLWHAGLAHGGSKITDTYATRRSLVGHYCPVGTRPLYHYYKPAQRKVYEDSGNRYTTSYYR
jgi:hypothetical protein